MPQAGPATSVTGAGRRYRVDGIVGKGAFGTVYRAEYSGEGGFSREVALKILNPSWIDTAEVAGRLRDEARLLGLLRHRAIVHVDGLVCLEGRWTVVMEYIDGVDLSTLLRRGPVPTGVALEIISEVAGALNVAYWTRSRENNEPLRLLHRDIKPSNILLTPAGEVKVVDFGVARADFEARETETSSRHFGSLAYMAPERLGLQDGPQGDVYALGAVLYELLAGRPLGRTWVNPSRHAAHTHRGMAELHQIRPHLGTPLKGFLSTLLLYEPAQRPIAREVEMRCRELRSLVQGGGWLREWAEAEVPSLLALREISADPSFTDRVLTEGTGSEGFAAEGGSASSSTMDVLVEDEIPTNKPSPRRVASPEPIVVHPDIENTTLASRHREVVSGPPPLPPRLEAAKLWTPTGWATAEQGPDVIIHSAQDEAWRDMRNTALVIGVAVAVPLAALAILWFTWTMG